MLTFTFVLQNIFIYYCPLVQIVHNKEEAKSDFYPWGRPGKRLEEKTHVYPTMLFKSRFE